ncbi:MAG: polysaccharide biosynthesis tyrosine autokinase [Xenococcaceae cyanobacterium MO_167.B27]|nr:polysaccharide biosynthesis tyrosine autokinase [Xenococcaceae cyanobacterium MO_167.B27]
MSDTSFEQSLYPISKNGNGNGNSGSTYLYSMPLVSPETPDEDEDSIDLRQLVNVVKHRLRLIVSIAAGMTLTAALWTFNQEPKYQGEFQLLVEPVTQEKGNNPLSLIGDNWTGLDYETQIQVLRSPSVLEPIIEKLAVRYPDLEYGSLIRGGKSPLKIERIEDTKILDISYVSTDPEEIKFVIENLAQDYLDYSLQQRRAEVNQGIEFVSEQLPRIRTRVDELQEQLQTFRQSYNLLDPKERASILSEQQAAFEKNYFNTQLQLNETQTLYNILQAQLRKQPEQAIATSYLSESPRYQKLLNELQGLEIQLAKESTRFAEENPVIVSLEAKKSELLTLLQQEAQKVLGNNIPSGIDYSTSAPSPSSLRSQLDSKYIQAANQIQILKIRESALASALEKLNTDIEEMPVIARKYTDLSRQLAVATASLNRFLEAEEKLELQAAQQALPWQIIAQPTVTENPVSPNVPRNLALGLIGGLLMGMGAALLAERIDPVFHSSEEIKESVNLPILGRIPTQKDLKPLQILGNNGKSGLPQLQIGNSSLELTNGSSSQISNNQHSDSVREGKVLTSEGQNQGKGYGASPFLESFRSLNTNIRLLGSDNRINSIVISSSVPSEGKSTISSHLAQAAAAMGQRVLLIDADLRRPQVHHWMGLENDNGLSNILATGLNIEEAIKTVPQWENLSVITAGDIPPDPTRLLSSQKMQQVMDQLQQDRYYDLIIYDTPPILGFADGRILASRTNGVVLVVRIGKTDRSLLKQNIESLKVSNVPVLGLVSNQTNRHSGGAYHYYSHYYAERT